MPEIRLSMHDVRRETGVESHVFIRTYSPVMSSMVIITATSEMMHASLSSPFSILASLSLFNSLSHTPTCKRKRDYCF
jgi:hypothetical protein